MNNSNGSTQISKYSYTYYVDGSQKSKTETVDGSNKGTTNYIYDGLNRLVKEQTSNRMYSYQYDSYGNRSQLSVTGDETYTTNYSYDKNNRLRNQTKIAGSVSEITDYWYDPNGNQISSMTVTTGGGENAVVGIEPAGGNTNSINEYDSWNQLTKTMQNGKTASYTYNGDGLRMSKTVDGTTTRHIWDGTNIAGDVTNGTVTKYIRGIQLISSKTGSNESFYTYNAHGDVVQLTNGSGNITKQYSYDAFGVEQNKDVNDTNPFRYCGEYFDGETESIYLRARYYSPVSGRFITEDPIRDGLNWYTYCGANPIMLIDTFGLFDYNTVLSYNPNVYSEDVVAMQYRLYELGYLSSNEIDGYFGQKTANAVSAYKGDMGLWNYGDYWGKVGLTTWQSLGLVYRTQADIDRGITIALVGYNQYFDVTKMFNDQLWYAEQYLDGLGIKDRYDEWYKKVNHQGDWDIKEQESWDKTFGGSYPGSYDAYVVLYGELSTPEEMGNIFYGYTGKVIGLLDMVLMSGSVYAAGISGGLGSLNGIRGEISDWALIQQGIDLYNEKHPITVVF